MSTITNYKKIPKDVATSDDLDFSFLKQSGIAYIESMGGGLWSDLNDHDPGVTFLELISYAITDLGARLDKPIADILTPENDPYMSNQFYKAEQILPSCPVTPLDYRKLFLDIDGVRNCWILPYEKLLYVDCNASLLSYAEFTYPDEEGNDVVVENQKTVALQGLNCVLVDYEDQLDNGDPVDITAVNTAITEKYYAHRNLCEDLAEIKEVQEHKIGVCATIELRRNADENVVHAQILDAIQQYFSTSIARYTLKQMLDKGYRTDEIYEGPFLEKGFIDTEELKDAELRSEVRLSDIVNIIMDIEGVKVISDITIQDCDAYKSGKDWIICINPLSKPVLAPTSLEGGEECTMTSTFNYKKDVIPVQYNDTTVEAELQKIIDARTVENTITQTEMLLDFPTGNYTDISETTTIQNDLPETYGISPYGLPPNATTARRSQAMQLKGYLAFFDQVLCSYFAHLGKVKELLSFNSGTSPTYFTQAIKDIKYFDELVNNYEQNDDAILSQELMELFDNKIERRNEFLDHLLARFAEDFSEYAFLTKEMYGAMADTKIIESKEQFLQEYVELSSCRGAGYNCMGPAVWDTDNVSGVEKMVSRKAGIENYNRRFLWEDHLNLITISNPPDPDEYAWELLDDNGTPILVSPANLLDKLERKQQICFAVFQLQNTYQSTIANLDEGSTNDGDIFGSIQILTAGPYNFNILDPNANVLATGTGYTTWAEMIDALTAVYNFVNGGLVEEGIYLVEHILLRPNDDDPVNYPTEAFLPICADDCTSNCALDPYSFRVSVVMPGMNRRFGNADFRKFMESLIQQELPSHILPRICWIGARSGPGDKDECELSDFAKYYRDFLEMKKEEFNDPLAYDLNNILIPFKNKLTSLHTIYPSGRLHDCGSTDFEQSIILGRSNI